MRVLVTGASGGMGGMVIKEFLKHKDVEIIATSRDEEKAKQLEFY